MAFEDEWGFPCLGYDIKILSPKANCQDYLDALEAFAAENLNSCLGCDGCCHERAPLTSMDMPALLKLLEESGFPLHEAVNAFGSLKINSDGCGDITLKRRNGACIFLNFEGKRCRNHNARPFVCRSHYCIPQSPRAKALRSAIVNQGEDELIRLLLEEEEAGAKPRLLKALNKEDYPPKGLKNKTEYKQVLLKEICPEELWEELIK